MKTTSCAKFKCGQAFRFFPLAIPDPDSVGMCGVSVARRLAKRIISQGGLLLGQEISLTTSNSQHDQRSLYCLFDTLRKLFGDASPSPSPM